MSLCLHNLDNINLEIHDISLVASTNQDLTKCIVKKVLTEVQTDSDTLVPDYLEE